MELVKENGRGLNRNVLKYIAVIFMVVDNLFHRILTGYFSL